jgi:hypothetical protein
MAGIFMTTDTSVYGREMAIQLKPQQIPSLQFLSLDMAMASTLIHSPDEITSLIRCLVDYDLPTNIRERAIRILTRNRLLSQPLLDLLTSSQATTLDFTGLDLSFSDDDLFHNLWSTNGAIKGMLFNEISSSVVQMFLRCQVLKPRALSEVMSLTIMNSEQVTDVIVMAIAHSFPHLQLLNVSECPLLTAMSVSALSTAVFASKLLSLNISHNQASSSSLEQLSSLTNLKSLNLSFLTGDIGPFHLNLTEATQLESLNLSSLHSLDDRGIECLLYESNLFHRSLRSLYLTENYLSDELFLRLFTTSPVITTSTSLTSLYQLSLAHSSSLLLHTLDLSWCDNITAPSLARGLCHCPLLERLYLRATSTDVDTVIAIARHCPRLIELNVSRCNDITDLCLQELSALRSLTSLDISWASILNESTIDFLYQAKTLQRLSLQGCKGLQSGVVDALLNNAAPRLEFLDLGWVNMFSSVLAEQLSLCRREMILVGECLAVLPCLPPPPP